MQMRGTQQLHDVWQGSTVVPTALRADVLCDWR
jgi:hypothetical protein